MTTLPFTTDPSWTIFLDRDGVINHEKEMDYVNTPEEFIFYDGVKEAMRLLSEQFRYIIIVTNQRGVGKGVTTLENLTSIHDNLVNDIEAIGGRIDHIYYCPDLEQNSPNRKPNPGMGFQAQQDHPAIDFSRSIMVGNNFSDMEFGRNLGAKTIFLTTTNPDIKLPDHRIDAAFESLPAFAAAL